MIHTFSRLLNIYAASHRYTEKILNKLNGYPPTLFLFKYCHIIDSLIRYYDNIVSYIDTYSSLQCQITDRVGVAADKEGGGARGLLE